MTTSTDEVWNARIELVKYIAVLEELVRKYQKEDPANLLNTTAVRLTDAHFHLYEYNKQYDAMLDARVYQPEPVQKSFWKKLWKK